MKTAQHVWSYAENEYCVEEVFKNFVIDNEYDYETVIFRIYIHFDGDIKKSSIKMKLQNIKFLLTKYNIPNTLMLASLENVAYDNELAFLIIAKKYNKLFKTN